MTGQKNISVIFCFRCSRFKSLNIFTWLTTFFSGFQSILVVRRDRKFFSINQKPWDTNSQCSSPQNRIQFFAPFAIAFARLKMPKNNECSAGYQQRPIRLPGQRFQTTHYCYCVMFPEIIDIITEQLSIFFFRLMTEHITTMTVNIKHDYHSTFVFFWAWEKAGRKST